MKKLFILIFVWLIIGISVNAQSIEVLSTEINNFPVIKSEIFIFSDGTYPVKNISQNQILINDKGLIADTENFICNEGNIQDTLKIVIAFDNAINRDSANGISNYDIALSTLNEIIKRIDTTHTNILLTAFDYQNYLLSDLTNSRDSLNVSILPEFSKKSSFIYPAFDFEPAGVNNLLDYYDDINTAVIITDGNQKAGLDSISQKFQSNGIKTFPVSINSSMPSKLKKISEETEGYSFEKITNNTSKTSLAKVLLSIARGYVPCEISWNSEISCNDTSDIKISIPSLDLSKNFNYIFEASNKPAIISDPLDIGFTLVKKVDYLERDIVLTAKNSDIFISDMYVGDDRFEIIEGNETDFTLQKDEFKILRIRFTPTETGTRLDSAIVFTKLIIESDACSGNEVFITAGYPNKPPITKTIEVTNPKCGETLLVGDTINVEWIGILRKDVVQIEYSTDNGMTWDSLSYNTDSLSLEWVVPDEVSDSCLIRVIQMWPNNVAKTLTLRHNGQVHSGFFNNEGDKAITASSDGTAIIWNSNTGQKEQILAGHKSSVTYAVFDPDEDYAATSSRDSTAKLWDLNTGELIRTFEGHTANVNSVNFSYDGVHIITAGSDGTVKIWETETGDLIKSFDVYPGNSGRAWFASFSPDDKHILTSGNDGTAKMINIQTEETEKIFNTTNAAGKGDAKYAVFNYNASKVAVVSAFDPKRVMVWEIDGKYEHTINDTLFTLSHNPDSLTNYLINSASFYYDGKREYILTSGSDNTARKWGANSGEPTDPHVFREHTNYVETAVFNFDARMVLTASLDHTAKIWNLDQRDLQMDTTDCNFAIAYADAEAYDITLGDVPFGQSLDTIIFPLKNLSTFDYEVSSFRIGEDLTNSFMFIEENLYPFSLKSLGSPGYELRFEAKELGEQTGRLEIRIPGKTINANISANSVLKDVNVYTNLVDFGKVDLGELKDTTFSVILTNISESEVTIDSIYLMGFSKNEFNFSGVDLPLTLNDDEYMPIELRFNPKYLGLKNAKLVINHSGRYSPSEINLFGISDIIIKDTVSLSVDNVSAEPGEIINVPVRIKVTDDKPLHHTIEGFSAELHFNSTLLEPLGNFKEDYIINDYTRCIRFDMDKEDIEGDIIKTIQFKAGLGNDSLSSLELKYSYPLGSGTVAILENDGLFKLTGFCNNEEPRLFDPYGRIALHQNTPNPAENITSISFEILEPGNVKIELNDILGKHSKTIVNEFMLPGEYTQEIDVSNLPAGTYIYSLITPNHNINRKMEIRK